MRFSVITLLGVVYAVGAAARSEQAPLQPISSFKIVRQPEAAAEDHAGATKEHRKTGDFYSKHFSSPTTLSGLFFQKTVMESFPDKQVTAIRSSWAVSFNLLEYAAAHPNEVKLEADHSIEHLSTTGFIPPDNRFGGKGTLGRMDWVAGYKLEVAGAKFSIITMIYPEGMNMVTLCLLVGDADKAEAFGREVFVWSSQIHNAILVFDDGRWYPDQALWESVQKASWDDVILEDGFKKRVQKEYRRFFKNEEAYKKYNVPWKRGVIFLGPPGNGKTISLKGLMKDVGRPSLYVKAIETRAPPAYSIRPIFERARREAPCVLIFEDLDSMITNDNRAFFLNEIDGLENNDGLLLIGTTNHFDRLDPALSNRPSRFDRKYVFEDPTRDERRQYAVYWQKKLADSKDIEFPDELLDEVADTTDKFSFAYLKEVFVAALISLVDEEADFAVLIRREIEFLRKELDKDPERRTTMADRWQNSEPLRGMDTAVYGYTEDQLEGEW